MWPEDDCVGTGMVEINWQLLRQQQMQCKCASLGALEEGPWVDVVWMGRCMSDHLGEPHGLVGWFYIK